MSERKLKERGLLIAPLLLPHQPVINHATNMGETPEGDNDFPEKNMVANKEGWC